MHNSPRGHAAAKADPTPPPTPDRGHDRAGRRSPASGPNTSSASATFNFTGLDGSKRCRYSGLIAICGAGVYHRHVGDPADVQGEHSFAVYAVDIVGNPGTTPSSYSWTIDTTAPGTSITSTLPASVSSRRKLYVRSDAGSGTAIDHYG